MVSAWTLFKTFLVLGCTSFGGPTAHLVFFHRTFVEQYQWLNAEEYSQLVALAQLLPGPTSSQVGLAIGYLQRGYRGAFLAWLGFTLPSILLMLCFAIFSQRLTPFLNSTLFHSIQLVVFTIVLLAFWQMCRSFCQSTRQILFMLFSASLCLLSPWSFTLFFIIIFAAFLGLIFPFQTVDQSKKQQASSQISQTHITARQQKTALGWAAMFFTILLGLPLWNLYFPTTSTVFFSQFFNASSSVFGGGHILLPLLHQDFVTTGIIPTDQFHLGYAFAQLVPGPLFSFSSYLALFLPLPWSPWVNVLFISIATFLSSFLLIFATLPYWSWLLAQEKIRHAVFAIHAAIVGLLLSLLLKMAQQDVQHGYDLIFILLTLMLIQSRLNLWLSIPCSLLLYQLLQYLAF